MKNMEIVVICATTTEYQASDVLPQGSLSAVVGFLVFFRKLRFMNNALVDHNPDWARMFDKEPRKLMTVLAGIGAEIHHLGSTAVPTIKAKPIIDILILVPSLEDETFITDVVSAFRDSKHAAV